MKQRKPVKKPAEVRAEFERTGTSIAQWARTHKLNPNLVYEILSGKANRKCRRGQSHRAAVLLGLKDGVIGEGVGA